MRHPLPRRRLHLGLDADDERKPFARYFDADMAPLSPHAREALLTGPVAGERLLRLEEAPRLAAGGYDDLENGFGIGADGGLHVAVRTDLPGVTPKMIDWWFGWHSDDPAKYKLWHPRAHVYACWDGGGSGYVGRTSFVDEYLGSRLYSLNIRFVSPARFGLPDSSDDATFVCARCGVTDTWLEGGVLIHHVRRVPGGAEMRSRFWLGGSHARLETAGPWNNMLRMAARFVGPGVEDGRALLVHCAQEMAHLGRFLPALHHEMWGT